MSDEADIPKDVDIVGVVTRCRGIRFLVYSPLVSTLGSVIAEAVTVLAKDRLHCFLFLGCN